MAGGISLLVDSPLQTLAFAMRGVPTELQKQIQAHTRKAALPIWQEETRARAVTRLEQRALVSSVRVGVTNRNVFLRAGSIGKLGSGTPVKVVSFAAEFGMNRAARIKTKSRKGTQYTRQAGTAFRPRNRKGYVVFPAASESISRFASLWVQTSIRTLHDAAEKAA